MTDITSERFGILDDGIGGRKVQRFTLSNRYLTIALLDYGVHLQSVRVHLADGGTRECVLGFDQLQEYLQDT